MRPPLLLLARLRSTFSALGVGVFALRPPPTVTVLFAPPPAGEPDDPAWGA